MNDTITIETTARGLHALLDPVLPFADKGDSMPVLATVRLCGKGNGSPPPQLTAAASPCSAADRSAGRVECPGQRPRHQGHLRHLQGHASQRPRDGPVL